MRERPIDDLKREIEFGITPAYAGKTYFAGCVFSNLEDHPRVCGKDCRLRHFFIFVLGSPPRMRERLAEKRRKQLEGGITPAYAGKTLIKGG